MSDLSAELEQAKKYIENIKENYIDKNLPLPQDLGTRQKQIVSILSKVEQKQVLTAGDKFVLKTNLAQWQAALALLIQKSQQSSSRSRPPKIAVPAAAAGAAGKPAAPPSPGGIPVAHRQQRTAPPDTQEPPVLARQPSPPPPDGPSPQRLELLEKAKAIYAAMQAETIFLNGVNEVDLLTSFISNMKAKAKIEPSVINSIKTTIGEIEARIIGQAQKAYTQMFEMFGADFNNWPQYIVASFNKNSSLIYSGEEREKSVMSAENINELIAFLSLANLAIESGLGAAPAAQQQEQAPPAASTKSTIAAADASPPPPPVPPRRAPAEMLAAKMALQSRLKAEREAAQQQQQQQIGADAAAPQQQGARAVAPDKQKFAELAVNLKKIDQTWQLLAKKFIETYNEIKGEEPEEDKAKLILLTLDDLIKQNNQKAFHAIVDKLEQTIRTIEKNSDIPAEIERLMSAYPYRWAQVGVEPKEANAAPAVDIHENVQRIEVLGSASMALYLTQNMQASNACNELENEYRRALAAAAAQAKAEATQVIIPATPQPPEPGFFAGLAQMVRSLGSPAKVTNTSAAAAAAPKLQEPPPPPPLPGAAAGGAGNAVQRLPTVKLGNEKVKGVVV